MASLNNTANSGDVSDGMHTWSGEKPSCISCSQSARQSSGRVCGTVIDAANVMVVNKMLARGELGARTKAKTTLTKGSIPQFRACVNNFLIQQTKQIYCRNRLTSSKKNGTVVENFTVVIGSRSRSITHLFRVMDTSPSSTATPNFARSVGRNTLIQFAGKIISTALGFATSVVILRYLHPEGNGAYTTAMAYLGLCSVIADLGLYLILIRDINKPGANVERIVGNLLALRWVSAALILFGGAAIVSFFGFTAQENMAVLIGTGSFVAIAATQLFVGVFQSKLAMQYVAGGELLGRVVLLLGTWFVVQRGGSLQTLVERTGTSSLAVCSRFLSLYSDC
jgi:hypothetical protein